LIASTARAASIDSSNPDYCSGPSPRFFASTLSKKHPADHPRIDASVTAINSF